MVSLMRTSFITMQYTTLEREIGLPIYLLSHSNISGLFLFMLCHYKALVLVVYYISVVGLWELPSLSPFFPIINFFNLDNFSTLYDDILIKLNSK